MSVNRLSLVRDISARRGYKVKGMCGGYADGACGDGSIDNKDKRLSLKNPYISRLLHICM